MGFHGKEGFVIVESVSCEEQRINIPSGFNNSENIKMRKFQ